MSERVTYVQARLLLLLLGVGVAGFQAILAHQRGAASTEVLAPLLYIPVFAGAIFWYVIGGVLAAALASLVYVTLITDQLSAIGVGNFAILIAIRVTTYFFYAVIIAIGVRYIENRLLKLEIYDQIDDLTGLYNSSFFLQDTDLEASRADRYQTIFSVILMDLPRSLFGDHPRRRYSRTLKDLAQRIEGAVRTVDRAARVDDGGRDRLLMVLPETGREGARVFAERLQASTAEFLRSRGLDPGLMAVRSIAYPEDATELAGLRAEIAAAEASRRSVSDQS